MAGVQWTLLPDSMKVSKFISIRSHKLISLVQEQVKNSGNGFEQEKIKFPLLSMRQPNDVSNKKYYSLSATRTNIASRERVTINPRSVSISVATLLWHLRITIYLSVARRQYVKSYFSSSLS